VEVGHFQAKFAGHFSPHKFPTFWLLGSLERRLVVKSWETSKIKGLQLQLSLLRVLGRAELVEKVGSPIRG
jgi:hypothetical protein